MQEKNENAVLIVDDHPIIQMGVSSVLRQSSLFGTIDIAGTGKEALNFLKTRQSSRSNSFQPYKLIIADINLPDYEIMNLISVFIERAPDTPILILSMAPANLYLENLVSAGVKGFINKGTPEDELIFAVKKVLSGHTYFGGDLVQEMVTSNVISHSWARQLSARENEVLGLLLKGISSKEISEIVNLHKSSIATYKARIYNKIGVRNSMEFYQWATKENLIQDT